MAGGRDVSRGGKGGVVPPQSEIRRWEMGRWRGKKPGNGEKRVVLGLFHQKDPKTGFRLGHKLRS
jgi:hypothetical protein